MITFNTPVIIPPVGPILNNIDKIKNQNGNEIILINDDNLILSNSQTILQIVNEDIYCLTNGKLFVYNISSLNDYPLILQSNNDVKININDDAITINCFGTNIYLDENYIILNGNTNINGEAIFNNVSAFEDLVNFNGEAIFNNVSAFEDLVNFNNTVNFNQPLTFTDPVNLSYYTKIYNFTTTQINNLSKQAGLIIYNTTLNKLQMCNGTSWETITSI